MMAKRKGDIEIGKRMAEELLRLFGRQSEIPGRFGCSAKLVYEWAGGITPGGYMLAKLHYFGGDVIYVLTGRRDTRDKKGD